MQIFEWTLALLVVAMGFAALARRWHAPYPSLLAMLGTVLVFLPGTPHFTLEPALALAVFVAPVLFDAAFDTSPRDLRDNWLGIASLVFIAVATTVAAVALTARALVPDLPWPAAIALGAIVAPPDAAAATAVLRQARPPHRILQILEGESLLNDATALLTYRLAVAAAVGGSFTWSHALPTLALVIVGSGIAGVALGRVSTWLLPQIEDAPTSIVLQFASTFGVWILAERIGLSGILTIVAYGITIARVVPHTTPARIRVPAYAVWETTVFVLNALAFVLIGLQLGPILERLSIAQRITYGEVALAVLGVCIATRIVWVMTYNTVLRWKLRHFPSDTARPLAQPTVRGGLIVSWCGMRGIVTLAAALALPDAPTPFPGRDLILVTAFTVVLGTLVVQGLTVRPLLLWLNLHDDGPVEREVATARQAALQAALQSLDGDDSRAAHTLRFEYDQLWPDAGGERNDESTDTDALSSLRKRSIEAARAALAGLRRDDTIGDNAFHRVEQELDRAELYAEVERTPEGA